MLELFFFYKYKLINYLDLYILYIFELVMEFYDYCEKIIIWVICLINVKFGFVWLFSVYWSDWFVM